MFLTFLGCSHCSSQRTAFRPGKDAVMSSFCVLLCNVILAHHILPAGSVEEVSAAAFSSGVSDGILLSARRLPDNVLTSVLVCLFQMLLRCVSLSNSLSCVFFFLYPRPYFSFTPLIHKLSTPLSLSCLPHSPCLLPASICVCLWMRTVSATSTTCGSTPCRTCWDTSTPTPSPSNLEAQLTSHYAPMCKCSAAPPQVHNTQPRII